MGLETLSRGLLLIEMLSQYVLFGGVWLLCRTGRRSQRVLEALDTGNTVLIGAVMALSPFDHPYPVAGAYEMVLALMAVLCLRAIIVPSSARRTLLLSIGVVTVGMAALLVATRIRDTSPFAPRLLFLLVLCWSALAVTAGTVASAVIYGLRKQVRDARKLGQYTLLQRLGAGAMGEVYLASHAMLRRRTAIKLLRAGSDGQGLERFEREVQLTSQLTHPNTIAIYDYGHTADGLFYYVMEYLEGVDLDGLLAVSGPQPPARVIHLLRQVCDALEEAHGQGLLHRDIKPANLFLCRRRGVPDLVKVLDFGLVKDLGESRDSASSRSGTLTGSPLFMAPEAISTPGKVDARSDLYSLGAVGYALLTGTHVFEGRGMVEVCAHHLHTPPEPPSQRVGHALPEDLSGLLLRCLAKRPEERFASVQELRDALEACADAGKWTKVDAERWWLQHGAAVDAAGSTRRVAPPLTGAQTVVAKDPMSRAA
ncbi:serine/threonine protein kinase [Archangium violaceum]|nr:serine/threonine protein kinase [Archangium violaceum]